MNSVRVIFCCCLFLAGCGLLGVDDFPDGVQLSVDDSEYDRGDPVTLILKNGSDDGIGYNLCTSRLQRRQDGSWTTVHPQADEVCTQQLITLPPGEQATYETEIPSAINDGEPFPPGTYRYANDIHNLNDNTQSTVSTPPFTVD